MAKLKDDQQIGKKFATHNTGEKDALQEVEKKNINNLQKKNELGM